MEHLPKLDRVALRREIQEEVSKLLEEVCDAVDDAPPGRLIRDSEERVRDTVGRFRQRLYELVMQKKVDAAEAAFPPSAQRGEREEETLQGPSPL